MQEVAPSAPKQQPASEKLSGLGQNAEAWLQEPTSARGFLAGG